MKRHLLTIICIVFLVSCKSQYVNLEKDQVFKLSSDCPKEGKCKVEVKDEFTYELEKGKGGVINPVFKENRITHENAPRFMNRYAAKYSTAAESPSCVPETIPIITKPACPIEL